MSGRLIPHLLRAALKLVWLINEETDPEPPDGGTDGGFEIGVDGDEHALKSLKHCSPAPSLLVVQDLLQLVDASVQEDPHRMVLLAVGELTGVDPPQPL